MDTNFMVGVVERRHERTEHQAECAGNLAAENHATDFIFGHDRGKTHMVAPVSLKTAFAVTSPLRFLSAISFTVNVLASMLVCIFVQDAASRLKDVRAFGVTAVTPEQH